MTEITGAKHKKPGHSILRSTRRVLKDRLDVLVSSFGINILSLALPIVILQVYDRVIPNDASGTLLFLMIGLSIAVFLNYFLRTLRSRITNWASARFEHAITKRATGKLLGSRLEEYEVTPVSVHLDRLGSIEALREFHSGQAFITLADLPFVALFLGLIWLIAGDLVIAPIAAVVIAFFVAIFVGAKLNTAYRHRTTLDDEKYDFLLQTFIGMHTVKILGAEAQVSRRYENILSRLSGPVRNVALWNALAQSMGPILSNMSMISVAAAGSLLVIDGQMSGGALIACTLLAGRAVQPVIKMIGFWVQSQSVKLAEERLDQLGSISQDRKGGDGAKTPVIQGGLSLKNVSILRKGSNKPVLKSVNLEVKPGEVLVLAGPPGGGQNPFMDLIAGLREPDEGELLYDDVPIKEIDNWSLRRQIGYVWQQSVMFRGTILDNLIFFDDRKQLRSALATAEELGLDEILARLPDGLETKVGDRATESLSRSVQQLISLTRTLGRKPKILLFAEANSALDMAADIKLRELLVGLKGETTVFMVTSRPSLMRIADRVLRFDRGRVIDIPLQAERDDPSHPVEPAPVEPATDAAKQTNSPARTHISRGVAGA